MPAEARMQMMGTTWLRVPRVIRATVVAVTGFALITVGVIMLVLPGPGIAAIALGFVVLATEFAWARLVLHHIRQRSAKATAGLRTRFTRKEVQS